jgi:acetyl-CoA carboxylase biotin carboxylase subunit
MTCILGAEAYARRGRTMAVEMLIANRGIAAMRVIEACNALNISWAIVYTEADENTIPVRSAEHKICLGKGEHGGGDYGNIGKIIDAARQNGVKSIHPGYGFLSENPEFALACEKAGIRFIGPSSKIIRLAGNKRMAKQSVRRAGIRVIPPEHVDTIKGEIPALIVATSVGFPVMLKAVSSGGGRGLFRCRGPHDVHRAFRDYYNKAFDRIAGKVILEKCFEQAKHIEAQILGDAEGNVIHFGTRDCSVQRKHQKLIEEAPAPRLAPDEREYLATHCVAYARKIGYRGLGTMEFLRQSGLHFLEMNTRAQVELPVTEKAYGHNLYKRQIMAVYNKTGLSQDQVVASGHAIECRIYAEDPADGFMPDTGPIVAFRYPAGEGVTFYTHIAEIVDGGEPYRVPEFYDHHLASLVVHAENRDKCIDRTLAALDRIALKGIKNNREFLKKILMTPEFRSGAYDTTLVEKLLASG